MTNRDFVLQRSWLDTGNEQYIINHSVFHKDYPPRKGYIRGNSIFTGYLIRQTSNNGDNCFLIFSNSNFVSGCTLGYVTQSDMQGDLPLWLVNKCTNIFAPKYVKQLEKAAIGYRDWKAVHNSNLKPWHYPEQISSPKLSLNLVCINSSFKIYVNLFYSLSLRCLCHKKLLISRQWLLKFLPTTHLQLRLQSHGKGHLTSLNRNCS